MSSQAISAAAQPLYWISSLVYSYTNKYPVWVSWSAKTPVRSLLIYDLPSPHVKITFSLLNIWLIFIQPRKEGSFAFECQLTCPHVCIISIYLLDIAAWGFHLERYLQPCQILPDSALVSTRFNPRLALVRPSNLLVSKIWHFSMSWWQKWPLYLTLFMFLAQKQLHSSQNSSNRALLTVNAPANTALLISLALLFTVSSSTEISGRTTP